MKTKIAVIDNGVQEAMLKTKLEHNIYIDETGACQEIHKNTGEQPINHGTECSLIIEKYGKNFSMSSITIFDENEHGGITKLQAALEWCYQNKINIINLSLGSTHFMDKDVMRNLINHYANKQMILVAASSNMNYKTYPASFHNVIGVAAGSCLKYSSRLKQTLGVDIMAPSKHRLQGHGNFFETGNGNSYAAPYITALAANLISAKGELKLPELKKMLYEMGKSSPFEQYEGSVPDWMECAFLSKTVKRSKAAYYFTEEVGSRDGISKSDTIVINEKEEFAVYGNKKKHIVYLGEEKIGNFEDNNFFWSKEQRVHQILASRSRVRDLDIPVIILYMDNQMDEILWLSELKNYFRKDGFHAYVVSRQVESVLYDLEYMPKNICNRDQKETCHDFLFWQTYYEQSDLIIVGLTGEDKGNDNMDWEAVDMLVQIKGKDDNCDAVISCNGQIGERKELRNINQSKILFLYQVMRNAFTEENRDS